MSKLIINNLALVLTEKCNFNCQHCMRGGSNINDMSINVMRNTFNQIAAVRNLTICGGEPLIDYGLLKTLIYTIIDSKLMIGEYSLITNGTLYTEEIAQLFDVLEQYMDQFKNIFHERGNDKAYGSIAISWDDYHANELNRISTMEPMTCKKYVSNFLRLSHSKYFVGYKTLEAIFNSGNATKLNCKKIELRPLPGYYVVKDSLLYYGPLLTILTDGTISECDGDFTFLKDNYNYGNINTDELEDIIRKRGVPCKSLKKWSRKQEKILKWYDTYK